MWQWLDETREEVTIKRKGDVGYDHDLDLDQDLEYDEDEWMFREGQRQAQEREAAAAAALLTQSQSNNYGGLNSQEGGGNVGYTQGARKLRSTVPVSLAVAMEVYKDSLLLGDNAIGTAGIAAMGSEAVSASQAWSALSEWLMRQYQVKAFPPNNTNASSSSGGSSYDQQQQVRVMHDMYSLSTLHSITILLRYPL